jgi:NADPH2:quinone reductase
MTTLTFSTFGGPEVLELRELPVREPGPGEVRIRVAAAPVQPVDLAARGGYLSSMLPAREIYTPGWDLAGVVESVGDRVTGLAQGDAVVAFNHWFATMNGTQGTVAVVDAEGVALGPAGVDPATASTLPLNGLTALQALDRLELPRGALLAVIGAAGSVGGFMLELARERGLEVYGVASAGDEAFVTGTGATFVERPDDAQLLGKAIREALPAGSGGVDGVLDPASAGAPALGAIRDGGRYVTLVAPLAPEPERGIEVIFHMVRADRAQLQHLVELVEQGALTLRLAGTFPLTEAAAAHEARATGVRGTVVLLP